MKVMKVNFNNLRRKLINDYSTLVKRMNASIVEDTDMNRVVIPTEDVRHILNNLRDGLVTLGCLYSENDPDCICVLGDGEELVTFNPGEE